MVRRKTKIKSMAPEKVAQRKAERELQAVNDVGAVIGLPEIQRDPGAVEIVVVEQLGTAARTTDRTIRKLSRVELLRRSGVLTADEAEACEWYSDQAAMAWDTTGCTANYSGGGGGGSGTAPDRAMAKNITIAAARARYAAARAALPEKFAGLFEAVVCHNTLIGEAAARAFADVKQRASYNRAQQALKECAAKVREIMEGRKAPDPLRVDLAESMMRMDQHVRAVERISDAISAAILGCEGVALLLISSSVRDAIARENGLRPNDVETFGGMTVQVVERWGWGWILERGDG